MFHVKIMSAEDLDFAVQITDTMDWGMVRKDFQFMMQLEPEGCFTLFSDSERVGIATTISFDRVGWFGNLIVKETLRGKGAGSLLVRHFIEYLTRKNVKTIGLYAYMDKIPFYNKLGFKRDLDFSVLKGKGFSSPTKADLREAEEKEISTIIKFDQSCFGASRQKILEPILLNPDNVCYVCLEDKQLVGYSAAKVYDGIADLGPLVCKHGRNDVATGLVQAVLNRLRGTEISLTIPRGESEVLGFLMKSGFSENFRVARMFRGKSTIKDCIYIAESLERG